LNGGYTMKKQLANGLILRTLSEGVASDSEQLAQFYADVNTEGESEEIQNGIRTWTTDLIQQHPTTTHDDIFVVVDPADQDRIVSATLLIPQTWRYEEIPLAVGRPELVGTRPEYRGKGLVRSLFEAVHERSAALGHELQGITGIPYFYRQFGYTMAVDLDGNATLPLIAIEEAAPDYKPAFTLRSATADDIPHISTWHQYMARQRLLTDVRSEDEWRHEILGRNVDSFPHMNFQVIVDAAGEGVGYLEINGDLEQKKVLSVMYCMGYVVGDQSSYLETFKDVMRGVKQWAQEKYGAVPALLQFNAGIHESLERLIDSARGGNIRRRQYLWYLRVPELIPFLRHIQPVLERRLEGSGAHRYTGELKIGFYNLTGIGLKFEKGRITEIAEVKGKDGYDISFPWNLFSNVLFGHHTHEEINKILPEVWANTKGSLLIDILFPKKKSWLKGLS
jgi:predicted N-acetyltransferase YhbS